MLMSAHISSRVEPRGLRRSDRKSPNRATLVLGSMYVCWCGMPLGPDTLQVASYRMHATSMSRKVAGAAKERMNEKYQGLPPGHLFAPVAIEILGANGPRSLAFLKELRCRIKG